MLIPLPFNYSIDETFNSILTVSLVSTLSLKGPKEITCLSV